MLDSNKIKKDLEKKKQSQRKQKKNCYQRRIYGKKIQKEDLNSNTFKIGFEKVKVFPM